MKILNQKEHLKPHQYKSLYLDFYAIFPSLFQVLNLFLLNLAHKEVIETYNQVNNHLKI